MHEQPMPQARTPHIPYRLLGAVAVLTLCFCTLGGCDLVRAVLTPPLTLNAILAMPEATLMYPHARLQDYQTEDPNSNNSVGLCCIAGGTVDRTVVAPHAKAVVRAWYARWLLAHGWRQCPAAVEDLDRYYYGSKRLFVVDTVRYIQEERYEALPVPRGGINRTRRHVRGASYKKLVHMKNPGRALLELYEQRACRHPRSALAP